MKITKFKPNLQPAVGDLSDVETISNTKWISKNTFALLNMQNFYMLYSGNTKLQLMVAETGWAHNLIIMEKYDDKEECRYCIVRTKKPIGVAAYKITKSLPASEQWESIVEWGASK